MFRLVIFVVAIMVAVVAIGGAVVTGINTVNYISSQGLNIGAAIQYGWNQTWSWLPWKAKAEIGISVENGLNEIILEENVLTETVLWENAPIQTW